MSSNALLDSFSAFFLSVASRIANWRSKYFSRAACVGYQQFAECRFAINLTLSSSSVSSVVSSMRILTLLGLRTVWRWTGSWGGMPCCSGIFASKSSSGLNASSGTAPVAAWLPWDEGARPSSSKGGRFSKEIYIKLCT